MYHARWDGEDGRTYSRSTRRTDPDDAWMVVATWEDVPRDPVPVADGPLGDVVAFPVPEREAPVEPDGPTAPADTFAGPPTGAPEGSEATPDEPPAGPPERATTDAPVAPLGPPVEPSGPAVVLLAATHRRYIATGRQPTPDEVAAYQACGTWLDPDEVIAWCETTGRSLRRDWRLGLLLLAPTAVSLGASSAGLAMLLPVAELAYASATVIACMVVALSWGLVGRYAPGRVRVALVVLAVVSVVTGFPAYYQAIGGQAEADRGAGMARAAYADLVARVVPPAQQAADEARAQIAAAWRVAREEAAGTLGSGRRGDGPRARALRQTAEDLERSSAALLSRGDRVAVLAQVDEDATPVDLHGAALQLWAASDPAVRGPRPERSAYVDQARESAFFLAYARLAQGSPLAWLALLLATGLDALTIYLGAGVVQARTSASTVRRWARRAAALAADLQWARRQLDRAAPDRRRRTPPVRHLHPDRRRADG